MFGIRWQPLNVADWNGWQHEMDRFVDRFAQNLPRRFAQAAYPALNVWEDNDKLCVEAELPGFEMDELEIFVNGGKELTIKGERKQVTAEGGVWHRQERNFGSFERTIELPHDVAADKVAAEFKLGVLTITLPKHEEAKPRRIAVKIS